MLLSKSSVCDSKISRFINKKKKSSRLFSSWEIKSSLSQIPLK